MSTHQFSKYPLPSTIRPSCRVCRLEKEMMKHKVPEEDRGKKGSGCRDKTSLLECQTCKDTTGQQVYLHLFLRPESNNRIFHIEQFKGKSCFEIYHSEEARGLWNVRGKGTRVCRSHPVYIELESFWKSKPLINN